MRKRIFYKEYTFTGAFEGKPIKSYIEFSIIWSWDKFQKGLFFNCCVPNYSTGGRNPFKVLFEVIEKQNVGNIKYQRLKEKVRNKGLHLKL